MKISVITPTYNSQATIADCIQSINTQTHSDIEHIVIDGGSTDDTVSIVQQQSEHLSVLISEPDQGIYDAMNKGIERASGDIIAILNSDDFYSSPDTLKDVAKAYAAHGADVIYGDLTYVDQKDTSHIVRQWKSGSYAKRSLYSGWHPPHPAFFVTKQVYKKYGTYRVEPKLAIAADYEFMVRTLGKEKLTWAYVPKTLVHMRTGGASKPSIRATWRNNMQCLYAWKINNLFIPFWILVTKPAQKLFQLR